MEMVKDEGGRSESDDGAQRQGGRSTLVQTGTRSKGARMVGFIKVMYLSTSGVDVADSCQWSLL